MSILPTDNGQHANSLPTRAVWAGRVMSGLAILALAMDATGKLLVPELMIANSPPLGLPAELIQAPFIGTPSHPSPQPVVITATPDDLPTFTANRKGQFGFGF